MPEKQLSFKKEAIKYLERLTPEMQERIFHELDRLVLGFDEGLDIKILEPKQDGYFRLRIGQIRVIYRLEDSVYKIYAIGPRGDVYK